MFEEKSDLGKYLSIIVIGLRPSFQTKCIYVNKINCRCLYLLIESNI